MFKQRLALVLGVLLSLALLVGCDQTAKFNNLDITGSKAFSGQFELRDHLGQVRHLEDYKGKVVVMFFGYTQCPDVCPTTMVEMQGVMKLLGSSAKDVQVLFVTVDPARDTQAILAQYVPAFDASFVGLRPDSQEALDQIARGMKIFYQKVPGKTADSYTIDHTAGSYVFDKNGNLRLFIKHGQGGEPLANDLKILLK